MTCFCLKNVLELHYNDNATAHVSVAPSSAPFDDQSIGINSLFAKTLGVDENSLVAVREIVQAPTIQSVTVTTLDDDDYSVLVFNLFVSYVGLIVCHLGVIS